ncbi:hypothetical protein L195_g042400, partial [Trifolium pratense]
MGYNQYDKPNPGCVHLMVHFDGEASKPILNVDPDRYSYFDLVDDVNELATDVGCKDSSLSVSLCFFHPGSQGKIPIKTDSDVLDIFKLNNMRSCIHVYAALLNHHHEETEVPRQIVDTIISDSDIEWDGDELEQNESEETNSSSSDINEEWKNEINIDELSDYEEKHDVIVTDQNSDEDKVPIYVDRGMKGRIFEPLCDGKVELEAGLLFVDVNEFRTSLRDFVIQEGFEIKRIKNEKARVTAICVADGCSWRIHASPTPDGKTYKIKTYNPTHSCIRTSKNSNATSTWIAKKLESKIKADPDISYAIMKQELLDSYGIEPSNVAQLYRARKRVRQDTKGVHAPSYNDLPVWANLALEINP